MGGQKIIWGGGVFVATVSRPCLERLRNRRPLYATISHNVVTPNLAFSLLPYSGVYSMLLNHDVFRRFCQH
jgi:hypothetical protein